MPDLDLTLVQRVHAISRFASHLVIDYDLLRQYRDDPETLFPEPSDDEDRSEPAEAARRALDQAAKDWGITHGEDLALLRDGDFEAIFAFLGVNGPKPTTSGDRIGTKT